MAHPSPAEGTPDTSSQRCVYFAQAEIVYHKWFEIARIFCAENLILAKMIASGYNSSQRYRFEKGAVSVEKERRGLGYDVLSRCRGELMGLAMLWVLLFHAFYMEPQAKWLKDLKDQGYLGVDVFILLSAMGLAMSLSRRKQSYGAYLKRRLVRVLPLYWLVVGAYGLILRLAGLTSLRTVAWSLSTLFYWLNKPSIFNWYIPGLLAFYLLAPPATALLKRCGRWKGPLVVALGFACYPLFHFLQMRGVTHLNDVLLRIPIFLLGLLVGLFIVQGRRMTWWELCFWAALPSLVPVFRGMIHYYYLPGNLAFALECVTLCLVIGWLLALLPQGGPRWLLRLLGECSLEIYLLNVVLVLEYPRLSAFIPLGVNHRVYYAVTVAANILLGITLHYLLKKPMVWLTEKVTGSGSLSRPPKGEGYSAEDPSGR